MVPRNLVLLWCLALSFAPASGLVVLVMLSFGIQVTDAMQITFLVLNITSLIIQIVQFVFIVQQIFIWRDQSPPP